MRSHSLMVWCSQISKRMNVILVHSNWKRRMNASAAKHPSWGEAKISSFVKDKVKGDVLVDEKDEEASGSYNREEGKPHAPIERMDEEGLVPTRGFHFGLCPEKLEASVIRIRGREIHVFFPHRGDEQSTKNHVDGLENALRTLNRNSLWGTVRDWPFCWCYGDFDTVIYISTPSGFRTFERKTFFLQVTQKFQNFQGK